MSKNEEITINKYDLLFESRLTSVETTNKHIDETLKDFNGTVKELRSDIRSDFRWTLSLMILFSGSLFGAMAKGFHWW